MTDDRTRLLEMRDAIARSLRHAREGRDAFLASETVRDAVILTLAMIGEAARNLSPQLRDANPDIPWKRIIGFRNRVLHGYFSVDDEIVWEVVEHDLPNLCAQLDGMLETASPEAAANPPPPTPPPPDPPPS
jgi:uncharacterized protein with HEPN domain